MTRWRITCIGMTVASLVAALAVYFLYGEQMRPVIPTHWDSNGTVDAEVPREDLLPQLLIFPGVMALMTALMWVLPWLSPRAFDVDRFRNTFDYVFVVVMGMFGWFEAIFLWNCFEDVAIGRLLVGGCFVAFSLLGNVIGQTRRNFWLGVRTPWTLASETVWIQTHRLAAWVWTPCSIVGAIATLCGVPLMWLFIYSMVYLMIPVPYSLFLYKRLERAGQPASTE